MKQSLTGILLFLLSVVALSSCNRTPSGVIPPDEMTDLLVDLHKGDAVVEVERSYYSNDSLRKVLKQSILLKHGVTQDEVDSSLMWYGHHLDRYMEVYDDVIARLESDIEETRKLGVNNVDDKPSQIVVDGDSVNIWPGVTSRRFSPSMAGEFITFSLNSDRNWERGDSYTLKSKLVSAEGVSRFSIVVAYNDGTSEYNSMTTSGGGWKSISLPLDSAKIATSVYGAIQYTPKEDEVAYIDSISLVRTRIEKTPLSIRNGNKKSVKTTR